MKGDELTAKEILEIEMRENGIPDPGKEYQFAKPRKWQFDYCWMKERVALEFDGGVFARKGAKMCPVCRQIPKGGHSTGKGYENDREKDFEAQMLGWVIIRVSAAMVRDGRAIKFIERALQERGAAWKASTG